MKAVPGLGDGNRNQDGRAIVMFDGSLIREHMRVVGSDGQHIGTVDRLEGRRIKLAKSDPAAAGQHHYVSLAVVERITDDAVCLAQTAEETRKTWQ
jgi:hypothetical protein